MKCPYCNEEMKSGYLQTANDLYWTEKPKKVFMFASLKDDFLIGETTFTGRVVEAQHCPNCKKVIIDVDK